MCNLPESLNIYFWDMLQQDTNHGGFMLSHLQYAVVRWSLMYSSLKSITYMTQAGFMFKILIQV